ncbi:MAG: AMP-binding protein [Gammaproteobacteria bacterium]|jgi:acyl-coenzyme A synthetase/AMP-(fatty) acid ligase|nr:AMP-binding protein [Gammaproteobacteria bacterium]
MSSSQITKKSIAWYIDHVIEQCLFESHVAQARINLLQIHPNVAERPARVLNLCENRYHFLVAFTASMLEGRMTMLPANRSEGEITRLTNNKDVQLINDSLIRDICQTVEVTSSELFTWNIRLVPTDMIVAELYTSGSTGVPIAHQKTWGQLVSGAHQVYTRFDLDRITRPSIVATVPPQHMFGFEMSIIFPLVYGVFIHHDQPFYPLDIQRAINEVPAPCILVTTPTHLKACITLEHDWKNIEQIISATSPLSEELASQVESIMYTKAKEIYGCSEVGAIATRRVTKKPTWLLLPDFALSVINETVWLNNPVTNKTTSLPDKLEILSDGTFRLIGRATDMIKIGGKRGSLAELTAHIKYLEGVEDAVVFKLDYQENQRERLAALVIAPGFSSMQVREALSKIIDSVFLPRPLYTVQDLPYTSSGKLPIADLLTYLKDHKKKIKTC